MAVVLETTLGSVTLDLLVAERPRACLNFLKLCKMKYYNYNLFHSVQSGFLAQSGDPSGRGDGGCSVWGLLEGPHKRYFAAERLPRLRHRDVGTLSLVRVPGGPGGPGEPDETLCGSQFFLTLGPDLDSLDGHCVIGFVAEGHEVLRLLNEVICDESNRPYRDVRVTHTVVLEDPFDDPPGLRAPSRSPSPSAERLAGGRIAPDEEIDETVGKTLDEINEMIEEKEAKARATILEIVGDLPDADVAPPENVLFVCKLNPVTTDSDLEIIFSRFGKIVNCEVIRDKKTGDSLQYAFIEFEDQKSCESAYFKMDNVLIDDRRIHVDFSQSVSKIKWLGKGRGVKHIEEKPPEHKRNISTRRSRGRDSERYGNREQDDGKKDKEVQRGDRENRYAETEGRRREKVDRRDNKEYRKREIEYRHLDKTEKKKDVSRDKTEHRSREGENRRRENDNIVKDDRTVEKDARRVQKDEGKVENESHRRGEKEYHRGENENRQVGKEGYKRDTEKERSEREDKRGINNERRSKTEPHRAAKEDPSVTGREEKKENRSVEKNSGRVEKDVNVETENQRVVKESRRVVTDVDRRGEKEHKILRKEGMELEKKNLIIEREDRRDGRNDRGGERQEQIKRDKNSHSIRRTKRYTRSRSPIIPSRDDSYIKSHGGFEKQYFMDQRKPDCEYNRKEQEAPVTNNGSRNKYNEGNCKNLEHKIVRNDYNERELKLREPSKPEIMKANRISHESKINGHPKENEQHRKREHSETKERKLQKEHNRSGPISNENIKESEVKQKENSKVVGKKKIQKSKKKIEKVSEKKKKRKQSTSSSSSESSDESTSSSSEASSSESDGRKRKVKTKRKRKPSTSSSSSSSSSESDSSTESSTSSSSTDSEKSTRKRKKKKDVNKKKKTLKKVNKKK